MKAGARQVKVAPEKERQALTLVRDARAIVIKDKESCEKAGVLLNKVKAFSAWWSGVHDDNIKRWKEGWDASRETKRKLADPLKQAEAALKGAITKYLEDMKQREADAQRAAQAAAVKAAEADNERAAKAAEKNGNAREAQQIRKQPVIVAPVDVGFERPKLSGVALTERWHFRITDPMAIPRQYLCPDEKKIQKLVDALKAETAIPGIEVYKEAGLAAGTGGQVVE